MAIGSKMRFEILKRDNFTCLYCGRNPPEVKLHVDHIIPKAQGGKDVPENLKTACQDCNLGKKDNPLGVAMIRARDLKAERKARREAKELQRLDEERENEISDLCWLINEGLVRELGCYEQDPKKFKWIARITNKTKIFEALELTEKWFYKKSEQSFPGPSDEQRTAYFCGTCRNLSKEQNG